MTQTLALVKKDVVDVVAGRMRQFQESGQLDLPVGYSPENAMKSAWLILQQTQTSEKKPVLTACTKDSIANSLLDMIVQGLNPAKEQGYFIAYGKRLTFQRSYFGNMALAKRVRPDITDIIAEVVYEGDTFKYKIVRGRKEISDHEQSLENVDKKKIKAAYCIIVGADDRIIRQEIMTFDEIKQSWQMSRVKPVDEKGNIKPGSTHGKFTADMAKRTVISKACKPIINSSSDNHLFRQAVSRTQEVIVEQDAVAEIAEHANQEMIDIEPEPECVDLETGEIVDEEPEIVPEPEIAEQVAATVDDGPGF